MLVVTTEHLVQGVMVVATEALSLVLLMALLMVFLPLTLLVVVVAVVRPKISWPQRQVVLVEMKAVQVVRGVAKEVEVETEAEKEVEVMEVEVEEEEVEEREGVSWGKRSFRLPYAAAADSSHQPTAREAI